MHQGDQSSIGTFTTLGDAEARARREYAALIRLTERHATGTQRRRWKQDDIPLDPLSALHRTALLAAGTQMRDDDEPEPDLADIAAALVLVDRARADIDSSESVLLQRARNAGLTWQQIAVALGVGSPQAARQRYERLTRRAAGD